MEDAPLAAGPEPGTPPEQTPLARAPARHARLHPVAVFAGVLAGIAGLYVASALALAGPGALFAADDPLGVHPALRFNAIYALLIAFTAAVHQIERRAAPRELLALRAIVDAPPERWADWRRRVAAPGAWRLGAAVALGALFGIALDQLAAAVGGGLPGRWRGHRVWMGLLAPALFATIGPMALLAIARARVLYEMGRRARVSLPEPEGLGPFARAGLRGSAYWFLGSAISSLLVLDADAWGLVLAVNSLTIALGVAALLLPSRGVHARLREAKRAELRWVRDEIARARSALDRPTAGSADVVALPALLAWEARVERAGEWPFDASTRWRFALFLAVPLASWLGGAFVERLVDAWIG